MDDAWPTAADEAGELAWWGGPLPPPRTEEEELAAHEAFVAEIVRDLAVELRARLGRSPTTIQVADACGLYYSEVANILPDLWAPTSYQHPHVRGRVWAETEGQCWYCGHRTNPFIDFEVDHVVPRARGGTDDLANLVPCCRPCNRKKRDYDIEEFRRLSPRGHCHFVKDDRRFWFELRADER